MTDFLNKETINEEIQENISNEVVPTLEPSRLVMILAKCFYSGENNPYTICIPGDYLTGIMASKKYINNAKTDCYNYCYKNNIFPLGKNFTKVLKESNILSFISSLNYKNEEILDFNIKVLRSSGEIENNWCFNQCSLMNKTTRFSKSKNYTCITVYNKEKEIEKSILLNEFCKLNEIDENKLIESLKNDLREYYNIQ